MFQKHLLAVKIHSPSWSLVLIVLMAPMLWIIFISLKNSHAGLYKLFVISGILNCSQVNVKAPNCSVNPNWIYDMHAWTNRKSQYSQGSQDFYLEKIFSVIQSTNKYFVEFGFNEPDYISGGSGANTRRLYENGWRGLLLDAFRENAQINLKKYFLFANNIAAIFAENNVPKHFDYLSCDMDSHDLWVFRSILQAGYRPRVITTEYNSNYPINDALTLIDPSMIEDRSHLASFKITGAQDYAWGASAGAFRLVAEAHGYTMVGRVGTLDLIWIRNDLLMKDCLNLPPFEWFFDDAPIGHLHHPAQSSPNKLSKIVDYRTFILTSGNITVSNQAARNVLKKRNLPCYAPIQQFL